ncbi:hypothetical protein [Lentibacillus sediminis]|uniref:hypothetical protein n=1 Tax=Lentibacillus sediminis TaxID=1940529 RepID=UPI000C1BC0D8|nr:hypothetical protein [Lentibacillus sediminis]
MKLNSLKGKIIAGTVAVGVVTSGGLVFANTDAGEQLQAWYDQAFGETVESAEEQSMAYGESLLPELAAEYNGMKDGATEDINETRDSETASAQAAIESAKTSHIENLESTRDEILEGMGLQFYNVFLEGSSEIEALAVQAQTYATGDLTAHTGTKGQEAVNKVTADLNAARDQAVSDLEDAIENARGEIEAELDSRGDNLTYNLNQQIDFAIRDLRATLDTLLEDLVQEQQTIITVSANALENEAINKLDEVVAGIGE